MPDDPFDAVLDKAMTRLASQMLLGINEQPDMTPFKALTMLGPVAVSAGLLMGMALVRLHPEVARRVEDSLLEAVPGDMRDDPHALHHLAISMIVAAAEKEDADGH